MSANAAGFDFSKFVPGFDFLKQMTQPRSMAPSLSSWIAPTLDPEEIERRIQELKTVQFWLEQNATALKATIQALEVQKLTCSTLRDMNAGMVDMAQSLQKATASAAPASFGSTHESPAAAASEAETPASDTSATAGLDAAMAQAGQWWGSLFNTFQTIAEQAQQEVAQRQEEFTQAQQQAAQAMTESAAAVAQAASGAPKQATAKPKAVAKTTTVRKKATPAPRRSGKQAT